MNKIEIISLGIDEKDRWNALLFDSLYPSYRQSMEYAYSKTLGGRKVRSYIFSSDNEDIAGVHYSVKQTRFGLFKSVDIISGFVLKYKPDPQLIKLLLNHFLDFAASEGGDYIRLSPWLPFTISGKKTGHYNVLISLLKNEGFIPKTEGRHTYWIDLTKSEEDLLQSMKRQTRYDVRQGLKSDIYTTVYYEADNGILDQFWQLYKQIAETKKFKMYSEKKLKHEVGSLLNGGLATLFIQKYMNKTVNISIVSNFGLASYLHGAIDMNYKNLKGCPSPGHLAQWNMMTHMKMHGISTYDMGFCPGPIPVRDHPEYNIWRFKYGFGGEHVQFMPVYEKVLSPLKVKTLKALRK